MSGADESSRASGASTGAQPVLSHIAGDVLSRGRGQRLSPENERALAALATAARQRLAQQDRESGASCQAVAPEARDK